MESRYDHPSFSSTLLDSIYRSFDESSHDIRPSSRSRSQSLLRGNEEKSFFEELMFKKQISSRNRGTSMMKSSSASLDRKSMIDDDEQVIRRRSLPPETTTEYARLRSSVISSERRRSLGSFKVNSSPASSSDSGSGGRLSSFEADLFYAAKNKKNALKPIRTSVSETFRPQIDPRPPKSDSGGKSAKARAMKLYGELKRMKQPISPGGKLASFLNNLFSANGGSKKQRISSSSASNSNFTTTNTTSSCSTASSYSRSCLSKRPSSSSSTSGRYEKRSVRFCPVSVIVDEDLKPCGHKSLQGSEDLKLRVMEEKRTVEEMARDLLRNYHHRSKELAAPKDPINGGVKKMEFSRDQNYMDDDDDDVESCCSSDLFELEIGVDRYCDELPVYETTRVNTNRAIATGLIA